MIADRLAPNIPPIAVIHTAEDDGQPVDGHGDDNQERQADSNQIGKIAARPLPPDYVVRGMHLPPAPTFKQEENTDQCRKAAQQKRLDQVQKAEF